MKVAYVLATNMASSYKLASMILPQLEQGTHGADVIGIFFFDDNLFCLRKGDAVTGARGFDKAARAWAQQPGRLPPVCEAQRLAL